MITRDDLKEWKAHCTMCLDAEDHYVNHYSFTEEPRLTYVDSGPKKPIRNVEKQKHKRTFYVDGVNCPDIDAVLTMLNAEPVDD